jgi:hypothetical protein
MFLGIIDQRGGKHTKWPLNIPKGRKHSEWPENTPTYFWYENIPCGHPDQWTLDGVNGSELNSDVCTNFTFSVSNNKKYT